MKQGWTILLLLLCSVELLFGQGQDSTRIKKDAMTLLELKMKINNYHSMLNVEPNANEKLRLYEQFSSIVGQTKNAMVRSLAYGYAKSNQVDSSAFWVDQIKDQNIKAEAMVNCAKEFAAAGNIKHAVELYTSILNTQIRSKKHTHESKYRFSKIMYEYIKLVPFKGNEKQWYTFLKHSYDTHGGSFPDDISYRWDENAYDAKKLLFYNYAQTLVHKGAIKPAAKIIAMSFQSGAVPDAMKAAVIKDFEHLPGFTAYLKEYELAQEQGFKNNINKLLTKKDVNGKIWDPSEFKGKYLLLDFWGSWCLPCRFTHPHLKDLYAKYKDKGFEILGIGLEMSTNVDDAKVLWKNAIIEDKIDWIHYLNNENAAQFDAVQSFVVGVFPTKILLDPAGNEIARFKGGKSDEMDKKLTEIFGF